MTEPKNNARAAGLLDRFVKNALAGRGPTCFIARNPEFIRKDRAGRALLGLPQRFDEEGNEIGDER